VDHSGHSQGRQTVQELKVLGFANSPSSGFVAEDIDGLSALRQKPAYHKQQTVVVVSELAGDSAAGRNV
jgi:hypothetical protein